MSAINRLGLIEFKNKTKKQKTLFDEISGNSNKAENMATIIALKEKINYALTWLSESEERIEELEAEVKLLKEAKPQK